MFMPLTIELAQKEDCAVISNVLFEAFKEFKNQYTKRAFEHTVASPLQLESRIAEGQVWVARLESGIVGSIGGLIISDDYHIRGMAVLPSARGQKVGLSLLKEVESFAKKNDCTNLSLSTTPYLKSAITLYENYGFQITNDPPHDLHGTPLFTMKKKLE